MSSSTLPTKYRPHKPRKAKAQSPHEEREVHLDRPKVHHVTSTTPVTEERPASLPQEIRPKEAPRPPLLDDDDLSESPPSPGISRRVHFPLSLDVTPAQSHPVHHAEKSPATPIKHSRIPSTGNRATVMDVAQVFSEHEQYTHVLSPNTVVTSSLEHDPSKLGPPLAEEELSCKPNVKSMVANWGPHNIAPTHADASAHNGASAHVGAEKRKSSHEKYSAFALPPLAEEKTPVPSPVGTLTKGTIPPSIESVLREEQPEALSNPQPAPTLEIEKHEIKVPEEPPLHLDIVDEQLPTVDVDALLVDNSGYKADPDVQTISVEVMSIVGASATPISRDTNVFYDTETLAIIHRSKAKLSGLVSTKVWAWRGVRSQSGEKEERKLQELARRYNTPLIPVEQYAEPAELVQVLGGQLATRQGSRAHWTTENTAMHMVRSVDNLTYIDELELSIRNLCSGFSYCLSLLETFYVWHGRGSTVQERQAALTYARNLASQPSNVIELSEESGDDDEMFWIILGEGDYGKADYWRWKSTSESWRARVWLVDTRQNDGIVRPIETFKAVSAVHDHVYIVDCLWEYFVLVGPEARGRRKDIRLALDVASKMSTKLAPTRPYAPTVHVLVLPSRLPIDLRLAFRDMDESYLNQGSVPEHMNLLAAKDAFEHLQKTSWERGLLTDPTMLPLGLADIY
ncbi:hypothetical protein NM688_g7390 [Phlebia brevispora]|uniref:Uncharacterized protein n=1 Tax=Phlebia brevispora TaxID=194682 RepID=A0ACC1S5P3_9APHY|nr:hypothetical protein NM688_g7390 [Phlebia brevispora]